MKRLPIARTDNIVVQNVENETLIYNLVSNKAYCLNTNLTKVYIACDGMKTFEELQKKYNFTEEFIYLSLDELKREELINPDSNYQSPFAKMSRREVVKKVGLSTAAALPLITSLVAPKAINAQSIAAPCSITSCTFDGSFTQGSCCSGLRCFDISSCGGCRPSNTFNYDVITNEAGCTVAACSVDARRNLCCNAGNPVPDYLGGNVCACRCP